MARFKIDGIYLEVPDSLLTLPLRRALAEGRYEGNEARALVKHVRPGDRVLDIGAGVGYLACLAARVTGAEHVAGVEANPALIPVARANLNRNDALAARLTEAAVVPDDHTGGTVRFRPGKGFWDGRIEPEGGMEVATVSLSAILAAHRPDVVVMDIEGGEAALAGHDWPGVRLVVVELHVGRYGPETVRRIMTGFFDRGFGYCPWGSRAETLVFERG